MSSLLVVSSVPVASCVGYVSTASGVVLLSGVTVSDSLFPQAVILSAKPSANSSAGIVFHVSHVGLLTHVSVNDKPRKLLIS